MQIIRKMMKETYCTPISLKIGAAVCNGIRHFAENLATERMWKVSERAV
jgi:hypothetical protein